MNKGELVNAIAAKAGLSKEASKKALDATLDAIKEAIAKNEAVALIGFGTFSVKDVPARQGVNPAKGTKIEIPAHKQVKFKVGAALADAVK